MIRKVKIIMLFGWLIKNKHMYQFDCEPPQTFIPFRFGIMMNNWTLQKYYRNFMKEFSNHSVLSAQDKKILNMLQLKMYDISQNVQILGRQLTNNQIKDVFANSYSIFAQMRNLFDHAGVKDLYEVVKKMQVNSVVLSSLLAQRADHKGNSLKIKQPEPQLSTPTIKQGKQSQQSEPAKTKAPKLGGVSLYNQSYTRGLQYYQVDKLESYDNLRGKCRVKPSQKSREQFLNSVSQQLDAKADVQVETIGDQIKKYIKDYKENSKINNFVSYEKELVEIIDFFKISELQAITFLHKSPNNQEYTQDYINRLNDLESELKKKQKAQKSSINQKLRFFIVSLRQQLHQTQLKYKQKSLKLQIYEKSLKKSTTSISTQTNDGYESRLKSQQHIIKQLQERYRFLSQIKNSEVHFESKYYQVHHELNIKVTQINKLKTLNNELQVQIEFLKKIVRENKDKLNIDMKEIDRRRNINRIVRKDISKKMIEEETATKSIRDSVSINDSTESQMKRSSKLKKSKRVERMAGNASSVVRPSEVSQAARQLNNTMKPQITIKGAYRESDERIDTAPSKKPQWLKKLTSTAPLPNKQAQTKQSKFKADVKKHSKKVSEQERQVSFREEEDTTFMKQIKQAHLSEHCQLGLSIDNIRIDDDYYEEPSLSRKNTLRQVISSSHGCSIKSFDVQGKKSSKSVSKKCVILKDSKEKDKNMLVTSIKFENFSINDVLRLTIYPHATLARKERPSHPITNLQSLNSSNPKSSSKLNHISHEAGKKKNNYVSTQNLKKVRSNNVSERHTIQGPKKNQSLENKENAKKSLSKKENLPNVLPARKKLPSGVQKSLNIHVNQPRQSPKWKPYKNLAGYFDTLKLKNLQMNIIQKINELPQQSWRGSSLQNIDTNSFVNFIIDQISKQDLNLQEFKEIAAMLTDQNLSQYPRKINIKKTISLFKQFENTQSDQQSVILSKAHAKPFQKMQEANFKQQKTITDDDILTLGEQILHNLQLVHQKRGYCQSKDNKPCDHLNKYLAILKKISEMGNQKGTLKLHIQKIGDNLDQYKSHKSNIEPRSTTKTQMAFLKSKKTNDGKASLDVTIDQEKERILPIISSTSSTYYKPKVKNLISK